MPRYRHPRHAVETVPSDGGTSHRGRLHVYTCALRRSSSRAASSPAAIPARGTWTTLRSRRCRSSLDAGRDALRRPHAGRRARAVRAARTRRVRHDRRPIRDFSVPTASELVVTLDAIDVELDAGGVVYVHCWAGCGRTGVVVGVLARAARDGAAGGARPHRGDARARLPADARAAAARARLGGGPLEPGRAFPRTGERAPAKPLRYACVAHVRRSRAPPHDPRRADAARPCAGARVHRP